MCSLSKMTRGSSPFKKSPEAEVRARAVVRRVITLSDIMLPELNGYRVCQSLRSLGVSTPHPHTTAKDGECDEADALDGGG